MDDALTVARSQTEESQAARMIYSTAGLFTQFIKYTHSHRDTVQPLSLYTRYGSKVCRRLTEILKSF